MCLCVHGTYTGIRSNIFLIVNSKLRNLKNAYNLGSLLPVLLKRKDQNFTFNLTQHLLESSGLFWEFLCLLSSFPVTSFSFPWCCLSACPWLVSTCVKMLLQLQEDKPSNSQPWAYQEEERQQGALSKITPHTTRTVYPRLSCTF